MRSWNSSSSKRSPYFTRRWKYEFTTDWLVRSDTPNGTGRTPYCSPTSCARSGSWFGSRISTFTRLPPAIWYSASRSVICGIRGASSGCVRSENRPTIVSGSSSARSVLRVAGLMLYSPFCVRSRRSSVTGASHRFAASAFAAVSATPVRRDVVRERPRSDPRSRRTDSRK